MGRDRRNSLRQKLRFDLGNVIIKVSSMTIQSKTILTLTNNPCLSVKQKKNNI